jgi:hypothetical protein
LHCPLTLECLCSVSERVGTHSFALALLWTECHVSPVWGLGTPRSSWAAYTMHFATAIIKCTVYTMRFAMAIVKCTVYTMRFATAVVKYTVYTMHFAMAVVKCTVYTMHFATAVVKCTVSTMRFATAVVKCTVYHIIGELFLIYYIPYYLISLKFHLPFHPDFPPRGRMTEGPCMHCGVITTDSCAQGCGAFRHDFYTCKWFVFFVFLKFTMSVPKRLKEGPPSPRPPCNLPRKELAESPRPPPEDTPSHHIREYSSPPARKSQPCFLDREIGQNPSIFRSKHS